MFSCWPKLKIGECTYFPVKTLLALGMLFLFLSPPWSDGRHSPSSIAWYTAAWFACLSSGYARWLRRTTLNNSWLNQSRVKPGHALLKHVNKITFGRCTTKQLQPGGKLLKNQPAWFCFHTSAMIGTSTYLSFNNYKPHEWRKWIDHNLFHRETSFVYTFSVLQLQKAVRKPHLRNVKRQIVTLFVLIFCLISLCIYAMFFTAFPCALVAWPAASLAS